MSTLLRLPARPATPEAIAPYGTLLRPRPDGGTFGPEDARLDLSRGVPRFYIMQLAHRPLVVRGITRHVRVTQCLAACGGGEWMILLAPPDAPDDPAALPDPARLAAFRLGPREALALHRGAWHAGPLFTAEEMAFFNLELADTNEVDHHTVNLERQFGFAVEVAADG
jgi:ureidoglycolate hydrolase